MSPATETHGGTLLPSLLLGATIVALVVAVVSGGVAIGHALWWDRDYVDATPADVLSGGDVEAGTVVWLRGRRDEPRAVTLDDGRTLYPTRQEPRVMVDCGDGGCEGTLVGRVEELTAPSPLPDGWPDGVSRQVRVVVVGEPGDATRRTTRTTGMIALGSMALGVIGCAAAAWLFVRRRRAVRASDLSR